MTRNGKRIYFSLGDVEVTVAFPTKKKKNAMTNWKEMVNCNDKHG